MAVFFYISKNSIMKKLSFIAAVLLSSIAVVSTGCKDIGTFTAVIDGQAWAAVAPTVAKTGDRITITGLSLDKQIVINIGGTTAGTYNMSLINGQIHPFVYTPDVNAQGAQQTYTGVGGSIVVTEISNSRITGSFNVTAANAAMDIISITGEFRDIKYF